YEKYRKVLRFYAFFKEAVVESPTENYRVRNVTILYYLEDDTLQINEPVVDNSALPQGTFVKRHKVRAPHASGKRNVHWSDLQVGETFTLYGRVFRITDADDFYEAQGMPQPEPVDMKNGDEFHGKKANPMKRFME
ncbi:Efhc1, partial [Symbiodinium sp. KB8]